MRAVATALLALGLGVPAEPPPGSAPVRAPVDENPCIGVEAAQLRCPDLVMRRPYGLYTDRLTKAGSTVLRAGNVIDSVGAGPAELRGTRTGRRWMSARQRIHRRGGGLLVVRTGARLQFKFAHQQRYWWKYYDAARFELWRVDAARPPHRQGPHRAQGLLLPARPYAHPAPSRRRAAPARVPGMQHQPHPQARHARAPRWAGPTSIRRPTRNSGST